MIKVLKDAAVSSNQPISSGITALHISAVPFNIELMNLPYPDIEPGYSSPDFKDHFKIIWVLRGEGICFIDLKKVPFDKNQLIFIHPGQIHRLQFETSVEAYSIYFTKSFLGMENMNFNSSNINSLFRLLGYINGIHIPHEFQVEMLNIILLMMLEFKSQHLYRDELLEGYLRIILIYLSRQLDGALQITSQTRNMELAQKFISLLEKNFKSEKMVSGYANLLSITPNYLNEIIKKTTGYSAGYHIRQRIVLEAKRHAKFSDTCMKQIGFSLGFNDMAHFSKYFKKATGTKFSDFKKGNKIINNPVDFDFPQ